jgi:uncharacterized damage-inducible protein DinB
MRLDDVRFLFAYDRWATSRVLAAAGGPDGAAWPAGRPVGTRELGDILVHVLGAHQRWRHGLSGSGQTPRPEREPLPSVGELAARWAVEWAALDAWLDTLDQAWLEATDDGIPHWQMLAHVVNHGTQHRSEAAALLTAAGRSPGDLDMIFFSQELATSGAS